MNLLEVDIAIIGGGMVGASLAALLPEHLRVVVVESFSMPTEPAQLLGNQPSNQPSNQLDNQPDNQLDHQLDNQLDNQPSSYDARSLALSYSTYEIFRDAGVWNLLQPYVQPILDVHVSDKGKWGSVLLSHNTEGLAALGYVIENATLGRTLLQALKQKPNVTFCCPATVEKVQPLADGVELHIQQNKELLIVHAGLTVIADGARSKICASLGIQSNITDYGHTAIITNVSTSEPHQGIAYERFTDAGPMALLPLIDCGENKNRSALVWTLPTAQAKTLLTASNSEVLQQLQQRFGHRQGDFIKVGSRHSYPLLLSTAIEQVRQGIVVLGNAAHSLHPVAGQGFNLALRDVRALCQILQQAENNGKPIGDIAVLQSYMASQQNDQLLTTVFSDILPGLFSSKKPFLVAGRRAGLLGLELIPNAKSLFVRFATGMRNS